MSEASTTVDKSSTEYIEKLQAKKSQIMDLVETGTDLEQAVVLTQTPLEMQKDMAADQDFMDILQYKKCSLEQEIVKKLLQIAESNVSRGISTEYRYILEHKFPERWGSAKAAASGISDAPPVSEDNRGL